MILGRIEVKIPGAKVQTGRVRELHITNKTGYNTSCSIHCDELI